MSFLVSMTQSFSNVKLSMSNEASGGKYLR